MYHKFNIQQSYVLPTQNTYVFCVDIKTKAIISLDNINSYPANVENMVSS